MLTFALTEQMNVTGGVSVGVSVLQLYSKKWVSLFNDGREHKKKKKKKKTKSMTKNEC